MRARVSRRSMSAVAAALLCTLTLGISALPTAATAGPGSIPAGFDLFETQPETTLFNFSDSPLPAGFFGPGSDPFGGTVKFDGVPIDPFDPDLGDADTVVRRKKEAVFPPLFPASATIPIELVQLSLVSAAPITVTYSGGSPEQWDVQVQESPTGASTGKMKITKTSNNGGTFDSTLLVLPLFTFTRPSDGATRTLDIGALGLGSDFLKKITLKGKNVPWQHKCPAHILAAKRFCPSVKRNKKVLTEEQARLAKHGIKPAQPFIEIDRFPVSFAKTVLQTPQGTQERLTGEGPTIVHVMLSELGDPDGDGLEQVPTEMVGLELEANNPLFGPIDIYLNPDMPTVGEIEETANTQVGRLDIPPFAPDGTADSFFDVFFAIDIDDADIFLHNIQPKRMRARITTKPPQQGETYEDPTPIDLVDRNNRPTGFRLLNTTHIPNPKIEIDHFPNSQAQIVVEVPTSQGSFDETVQLSGPTTIEVLFENVGDRDADGLEEVPVEIVELSLTGSGPNLGPVQVRLRQPSKDPFEESVGFIEETQNTQPGRLDLPPFAPSGQATSFFDVFFEVEVQGRIFHNDEPKVMVATIRSKPPAPGDTYFNELVTILLDENNQDSGKRIKRAQHTPNPGQQPPPQQSPYQSPQ